MNDENRYQAYLIRFKRGREQSHWHVDVQNAHTGERHRFVTERELFRFLKQSLTVSSPDEEGPIAPDNKV